MGRYIGIDYGTRRIGIAISDPEGRLAFPQKVVENEWNSFLPFLLDMIRREKVVGIVIGLPLGFENQDTVMTRAARDFAGSVEREISIPVVLENEVLSTKAAQQGPTKKELIDAASATLILQGYLDRQEK